MTQAQHEIPLVFKDGSKAAAVRTGNNAAWICACGRLLPLLGYSATLDSSSAASVVACPDCDRRYRVVATAARGVPTEVRELVGAS